MIYAGNQVLNQLTNKQDLQINKNVNMDLRLLY